MKRISETVEKYKDLIYAAERFIWNHPETGFKEIVTSEYMAKQFIKLGYKLTFAENITGFYTVVDTGRSGPEILVLAEMDSLICAEHKAADSKTGAAHACGHNAQCAALIGIVAALKEPEILENLCGKIKLCAVPAEESIEMNFRRQLKKDGLIKYYGGKREFLSRGFFDDVDLAIMVHTARSCRVEDGAIGFLTKEIIYKGQASHAGSAPWFGKNALYAANCGINAVNAIRETFKEEDLIRVHMIVTHGGEAVNAIPANVGLEMMVRGKTYDAIMQTNKKINEALCGAALSIGTNIEIIDNSGCAPLKNDKNMCKIAEDAFKSLFPEREFSVNNYYNTGSTDMGDLSCIMPVVQPYISGAKGTPLGKDYDICDPQTACVDSAKWQVAMIEKLLENNAEKANKVIKEYKPPFPSKKAFLDFQDSLESAGDRIIYKENGTAEVRL